MGASHKRRGENLCAYLSAFAGTTDEIVFRDVRIPKELPMKRYRIVVFVPEAIDVYALEAIV